MVSRELKPYTLMTQCYNVEPYTSLYFFFDFRITMTVQFFFLIAFLTFSLNIYPDEPT